MAERRTMKQKFWEKVDVGSPENCWEWGASRTPGGYGQMTEPEERTRYAHRLSWIMARGPIPDGMLVLHACDNPPCVNPRHLFLGTQKDNIQDMIKKGRQNFRKPGENSGEKNGRATMTSETAAKIKSEYDDLKRYPRSHTLVRGQLIILARKHEVSKQCVQRIGEGSTWRSLRRS